MWKSRSVFCGGFSKQLVEIINKKAPQATFVDFHSCGIFHSLAPADFGERTRRPIFVMGKIRRKFETEFKRQLIAEIEGDQTTIGQAARDHQISRSVIE